MQLTRLIIVFLIALIGIDRGYGGPPGLYLTETDLVRVRGFIENKVEPFYSSYQLLISRANSALNVSVDPFSMSDITQVRFGWCENAEAPDDSLKDLTKKLESQSDKTRTLALTWLLTGNESYATGARNRLVAWASESTLLNMYDLKINFGAGSFSGMTTDGYCGVRPWNMALDSMWQCYGLINFADTYVILKNHKSILSTSDDQLIRDFLLELTEAVNSGFHAWTRWADAHPNSSAYKRYRSDNHLSWSLAGLIAGAVALGDDALAQYVLQGSAWNDSHAGLYANPSSIRSVIDLAVESGTGEENEGRIFEEKISRDPPIGYSFFHLWAMSLVAAVAEKHYGDDVWNYKGTDGAGLREAYERYSAFVLGERSSPEPSQDGDLKDKSWHYEFAYAVWPTQRFEDVLSVRPRDRYIVQGVGPITLIMGREFGYPVDPVDRVDAPIFSPKGGSFLLPVNASLACSTSSATIRYTNDGTIPSSTSEIYSEPLVLSSSTILKAFAMKDGMENSSLSEADFSIGEIASDATWYNESIETQTGGFQIAFDIVPSSNSIDGVTGLGNGVADEYDDLAAILQFYTDGLVRARNGDRYEADVYLKYQEGIRYRVRMLINVQEHTYSVFIAPHGLEEIKLAADYVFRTPQGNVPSLSYISARTIVGNQSISNVQIAPGFQMPPKPPTGLRIVSDPFE